MDMSVAEPTPQVTTIHSEPLGLARMLANIGEAGLILAAHSEAQAARLAAAARALAPGLHPMLLPGWDCLPYDRASPSRAVMGQRMDALRVLAAAGTRLLVAPIETLAQRLPDPATVETLVIEAGQAIDRAALLTDLDRLGYALLDEADQPGEVAAQGAVIDLAPADGSRPVRIRLDGEAADQRVAALDRYDAATQRSRGAVARLEVGPASELVRPRGAEPLGRTAGQEHRLPELAGLVDVFDLLPSATLALDADADSRLTEFFLQIEEARATRLALCRATGEAPPPDGLYLDRTAWDAAVNGRARDIVDWPETTALPDFRAEPHPEAATERFIAGQMAQGRRVGLSGKRLAQALDMATVDSPGWQGLLALPPGTLAVLPAGIARGFVAEEATLIGADDVLPPRHGRADHAGLFDVALRPGDAVIHLDYGMARLDGIETVQAGNTADCLVLGFADGARKLAPCAEMDRVWRHGGAQLSLDRADGSTWRRRQGRIVAALDETAASLVAQADHRARLRAPALKPPRRGMETFIAGFPFTPTQDQDATFADIAADLARPHPMDRLLCGDVGFGKTEAALRAAAAAALAGQQVAILAPTTVLVRQHFSTFRRRFAPLGIEVASLSRLTRPAEARGIREKLADGTLPIVIGTQALASPEIAFARLALVVIDEEQRFGTKAKAALTKFRSGVHGLVLSATPIPRTLQGALAGLQALSVLTTPPARRQPVRTTVLDFDEAVLRAALTREHARGGQSFCVCPRIEDFETITALLDRVAPDLSVIALHGRMKPDAIDGALSGFAEGHGDILLSTDIIEAGLDIPRANTILVWRADLFGLAQLHQLRGRVGRGRTRGMAWLFTDPARPPTAQAAERLAALAAHDGLGAGFAVAARDLDIRGAGDLLGDEQAGHAKLLGVELARHLLARAMARARGEALEEDWRPEMVLDLPATIPADYMPDPAARIALHARLARPGDTGALAEELEDRFGPLPDAVRHLLAQAELRAACVRLGVARLEAGPVAVAADMRAEPPDMDGLEKKASRLILRHHSHSVDERLALARALLRRIARAAAS